MTVVVWVLVLWAGSSIAVVDNIASEQNCRGLLAGYKQASDRSAVYIGGDCFAVRKVNP